jgi:hypothetical protein
VDVRDWVGVACSGGATRAVRPAVEVNGGGGAPVVGGGEKVVGELQGGVEKLGVEAIGVEEGRRGVPHGEQKAAAGEDRSTRRGAGVVLKGTNWEVAKLHGIGRELAEGLSWCGDG